MFGLPGWMELGVIVLLVLLLFGGATKIPKLARSMGQSVKEFQKGKSGALEDEEEEVSTGNQKKRTEGKTE